MAVFAACHLFLDFSLGLSADRRVCLFDGGEGYNLRPRPISNRIFTTIPMSCTTRIFYRRSKIHSLLVVITVPLSTGFALLISLALSSIKRGRRPVPDGYFSCPM